MNVGDSSSIILRVQTGYSFYQFPQVDGGDTPLGKVDYMVNIGGEMAIAPIVEAKLTGGNSFNIIPNGETIRGITTTIPVEWIWIVEANESSSPISTSHDFAVNIFIPSIGDNQRNSANNGLILMASTPESNMDQQDGDLISPFIIQLWSENFDIAVDPLIAVLPMATAEPPTTTAEPSEIFNASSIGNEQTGSNEQIETSTTSKFCVEEQITCVGFIWTPVSIILFWIYRRPTPLSRANSKRLALITTFLIGVSITYGVLSGVEITPGATIDNPIGNVGAIIILGAFVIVIVLVAVFGQQFIPSRGKEKSASDSKEDKQTIRNAEIFSGSDTRPAFNIINEGFNIGELRQLCFDLDVDYEILPGEEKRVKAMELIQYFQRRDELPKLELALREKRPEAWIRYHSKYIIIGEFNMEELRNLCLELDVNYETLPGIGISEKAEQLVIYLSRNRRLSDLEELLREKKPDSWNNIIY